MSPSVKSTRSSVSRYSAFAGSGTRGPSRSARTSCWAFSMIARAPASFSTARRCAYQPIASVSSSSDVQIRASVRASLTELLGRLVVLVEWHAASLPGRLELNRRVEHPRLVHELGEPLRQLGLSISRTFSAFISPERERL